MSDADLIAFTAQEKGRMPGYGGKLSDWIRSVDFLGRDYMSFAGTALTTASAAILVGFWVISVLGHGG
jgi:hypothetical protein